MSDSPISAYEFGPYRIDMQRYLVLRDDRPIQLSPKVFRTLLVLVQRRDRVVSKQELIDAIWPDSYVEEGNLAQNIFVLRRALGEEKSDHSFIITIPGHGYRFVAPVTELGTEGSNSSASTAAGDSNTFLHYIRGRYFWNQRTGAGLKKAIQYAQRSLAADPAYAPAYVGIADSYNLLAGHGGLAPKETFPKAKTAAFRALEIDPRLAAAYVSLAFTNYRFEWDWVGAETNFRRAIELEPNYPTAHHWYGEFLACQGRFAESINELEKAMECDPLSLAVVTDRAQTFYFARQYELSLKVIGEALEMDPQFVRALIIQGNCLEQLGRYEEATEALTRAADLSDNNSFALAGVGHNYALQGKWDEAIQIVNHLREQAEHRYISASDIATVLVGLGQKEEALSHLERSIENRDVWMVWLKVNPRFEPIQREPRYQALLKRVGLQ